jgi:transcription elongation factor GreB
MSRWRLPVERSAPYITPEGLIRLRAEYDELWLRRRPEVVKALTAAAAEGDRSENAEYQYRKKELREIDRRVRYLQVRIPQLQVVDRAPADQGRIYFGAWVAIEDPSGRVRTLRIVGVDEVDAGPGRVSVDSPLSRALLRRAAGEQVHAQLPAGEGVYEILSIRYVAPGASTWAAGA